MKIGIITFVNEDNYGAVLQAYALQNYLSDHQIESEFINVKLSDYTKSEIGLLYKIYLELFFLRKKLAFKKFRNILRISKDINLKKYDCLIIGSDQVWNPKLMGGELQGIFWGQDFDGKIIAYACSCGNVNVLNGYEEKIVSYLNKFNSISVREKTLLNKLHDIGINGVKCVLDPVFLLDKNSWISKLNFSKLSVKNYIFVYLLEDDIKITNAINKLSQERNLKVITLRAKKHYNDEIKRFPAADPKQFLELINNAEIIVSNSFHALAFSKIFQKEIALFPHSRYNDRINDFLELNCLNSKDHSCYYDVSGITINFKNHISKDFLNLQIESKEYLTNALKGG